MRGKVHRFQCFSKCHGITPAYAGKSGKHALYTYRVRDHPRLCGEKDKSGTVALIEDRITPAYAGKRVQRSSHTPDRQDHPRLCGEKLNGTNGAECVIGSPPPMRGKEHYSMNVLADYGITPAYAGKSSYFFCQSAADWDHPRLCGEKKNTSCKKCFSKGSPPPMRGKELDRLTIQLRQGITPAYAGKSKILFKK